MPFRAPFKPRWSAEFDYTLSNHGSTHDFTADTTEDVNGIEWTAYNEAGATTFDLDNSTGLRITPGAGRNWDGGTDTSARVTFKVSDAAPGWNPGQNAVCVQAWIDVSTPLAADFDSIAFGPVMSAGAVTGSNIYMPNAVFNSGYGNLTGWVKDDVSDAAPGASTTRAQVANLFEFIVYPSGITRARLGYVTDPSAGFPAPDSTGGLWAEEYGDAHKRMPIADSATQRIDWYELRAAFACYKVNSATALTATLKRVRVLTLG